MDIRKIQKTGDMHYMYLPTSWCKKHNITSSSRVSVDQNNEGILSIHPQITEKKLKHIKLSTDETSQSIIQKLIVACYINPSSSFNIKLEKSLDFSKLLDQKRIISLESVEMDKNDITCESAVMVSDPYSLLKTMIRKIKNMLIIMVQNYHKELINRYEEEIDKNKLLIDKSIIGTLTFHLPTKMKTIDLYYISLIGTNLERMVDHLINIDKKETIMFKQILGIIDYLKNITENINNKKSEYYLNHKTAIQFIKKVEEMKNIEVKDVKTYDKRRIKGLLSNISETIVDWAITKELEDVP